MNLYTDFNDETQVNDFTVLIEICFDTLKDLNIFLDEAQKQGVTKQHKFHSSNIESNPFVNIYFNDIHFEELKKFIIDFKHKYDCEFLDY